MPVLDLVGTQRWGIEVARAYAQQLLGRPDRRQAARDLLAACLTDNAEQRKRAADVARRITETDAEFLAAHAAELGSLLAEIPLSESRTRWHLGLVVAWTANTPQAVRLATALMWRMSEDKSNGVRCSAVEGLGLLALRDPSLRPSVEPYLHQAFLTGTPAMRVRARDALRLLQPNRSLPRVSGFGHPAAPSDTSTVRRVRVRAGK